MGVHRQQWQQWLKAWLLSIAAIVPVPARANPPSDNPAPRVVVLAAEGGPATQGFMESLRIQLTGIATVVDGGALKSGTHSERIEQGLGAAEIHAAVAAIWVEGPAARSDGTDELVLYVVGHRDDRAIVDVLRVPTRDSDSLNEGHLDMAVDRSLALKVRQVLSDLGSDTDVIEALPPRSGESRTDNIDEEPGHWVMATVGLFASTPSGAFGVQPGLRVGGGLRAPFLGGKLDLIARAHLTPRARISTDAGTLELHDLSPAIETTWSYGLGRLSLGARVAGQIRVIEASGLTTRGVTGTRTSALPSLLLGPCAFVSLGDAVALVFAVDLEVTLVRQRYAVNDAVLGDSGQTRATFHLGLSLAVP